MAEHQTRVLLPVDPPQPVWLAIWLTSWEPRAELPALLHEWEGVGPPGMRRWWGRVSLEVADPPPAWDPKRPWVFADDIRPRDT